MGPGTEELGCWSSGKGMLSHCYLNSNCSAVFSFASDLTSVCVFRDLWRCSRAHICFLMWNHFRSQRNGLSKLDFRHCCINTEFFKFSEFHSESLQFYTEEYYYENCWTSVCLYFWENLTLSRMHSSPLKWSQSTHFVTSYCSGCPSTSFYLTHQSV